MQREQKITPGEMRSSGGPNGSSSTAAITSAAHSVLIDAGRWGDDVRLSDMEPKFTCQRPSGRADVGRSLNKREWERGVARCVDAGASHRRPRLGAIELGPSLSPAGAIS
jgi:hypothetical protein